MPEVFNVVVPPGIGDFSWVWMKLSSTDVLWNVLATDGGPGRLGQISEIVPGIYSNGAAGMGYNVLRRSTMPPNTTRAQLYAAARRGNVLLEANAYLEDGNRIESWLPDIPVDFHFEIEPSQVMVDRATSLVPDGPFVVVFAANIHTIHSWGSGVSADKVAWTHHHWVEFMRLFRERVADIPFVVIGVSWDQTVADAITAGAAAIGIRVVNLCGKLHLGESLHAMSLSSYGLYFPSGMGVLAQVIEAPATMFYADVPAHHGLIGSWADPELIKSGEFTERVFCPVEVMVDWIRDVYKLQNRL